MHTAIHSENPSSLHTSTDRKSTAPRSKKTRTVRRRGRAKTELESDDEIEREVGSDSETDDQSSLDSESETESASDDDAHPNGRSEVVTPSTTQSPPPEIDAHAALAAAKIASASAGPFAATTNWADMVSAEKEGLPVIDFADLNGHALSPPHSPAPVPVARVRKQRPGKKAAPSRSFSAPPASPPALAREHAEGGDVGTVSEEEPELEPAQQSIDEDGGAPGPSHAVYDGGAPHSRGQSARQAYQERLENDPQFVPKVGGFWGHDDRLLDKDLRSLSGWWRGRWQSRVRGRGGPPMRGRGGCYGRFAPPEEQQDGGDPGTGPQEVPPIEQAWTHDGFEEMKRRDEQRRMQQDQQAFRSGRGAGFRGRGGYPAARGRGGFSRGGMASPLGSRPTDSPTMTSGRIWYAQKPERVWTKQHEAFLYFDPNLKPRPGQGPGFRVKFPGKDEQIIRTAPRAFVRGALGHARTTSVQSDGALNVTVRIPLPGKAKAVEVESAPVVTEEPATTVADINIDEVFTVRPNLAPTRIDIPVVRTEETEPQLVPSAPSPPPAPFIPQILSQPQTPTSVVAALQPLSEPAPLVADPGPSLQIQESILRNPPSAQDSGALAGPSDGGARPAPPPLHPLQTSFSPAPQAPSYSSPYTYAPAPALPPGIAMNQHGVPYELATGRAVYLPTPPPPPPPQQQHMYTPRPMMHVRPASVFPAYMQPQPSPAPHTPVHAFDPNPGVPIFAPARQSSRIEIRAPGEGAEGKKARSSGLRASVSSGDAPLPPEFVRRGSSESSVPATNGIVEGGEQQQQQQQLYAVEQGMMYNPYQQQYYYPEYGYAAPYMEMSPQMVPYEMYAPPPPMPSQGEHRAPPPPPMIYY